MSGCIVDSKGVAVLCHCTADEVVVTGAIDVDR